MTLTGVLLVTTITFVFLGVAVVTAARCQVRNVSYVYPHQASPNQPIQIDTIVSGSCASTGQDYYHVRVDLVDELSNSTLSYSNAPIGYDANNFTVTAVNPATTPSENVTWLLQMHVYVIRAGGTSGPTLLDYQTTGNATIQVGATVVPEFRNPGYTVIVAATIAVLILLRRRRYERVGDLKRKDAF
jgi:hypothetical protein